MVEEGAGAGARGGDLGGVGGGAEIEVMNKRVRRVSIRIEEVGKASIAKDRLRFEREEMRVCACVVDL